MMKAEATETDTIKNVMTFEAMGLNAADPFQVAAYAIGLDLFTKGKIYQFDPSVIMLIIEILQSILPLLEQYCPNEAQVISEAAANLRPAQRFRWIAAIRSRAIRTVGRRAWRDVGANDFADRTIELAGQDAELLGRVMMAG